MGSSEQNRRLAVDLLAVLPGGANGGAKLLALDLVEGLSRRWAITCFCLPGAEPEIARILGDKVRTVCVARPADLAAAYDAQVARDGPFAANFFPMQCVSLQRAGTATISVVHDLQFADLPENFTPAQRSERAEAFRTCVERSDLIVTVSDFSRRRIEAIAGIDGRRIKVIHSAPRNLESGQGASGEDKAGAGSYFIYPANLWPHKNHARLLDAYRAYREAQVQPWELVLTGEPSVAGRDLLAVLRAEPGVRVTGFLERSELSALMAQASALVFPSLYEGFGIPLVEAMAAGTPILCSNAGALPEIAGQAALVFDGTDAGAMAKAMGRMAGDAQLRATLAAAGRERLRELGDFPAMLEAYHAAIETAIAAAAVPPARWDGVEPGGWAGAEVTLELPEAGQAQLLRLQLALPAWAPLSSQVLVITSGSRPVARGTLWPGQHKPIDLQLHPGERSVSIRAAHAFRLCDVLDTPSRMPISYRLEAASSLVNGREFTLWPAGAAGDGGPAGVVLLVVDGMPETGLRVAAVSLREGDAALGATPDARGETVRFEWRSDPPPADRDRTELVRLALPPAAAAPAFRFAPGIEGVILRAREPAAPAIIADVPTEGGFSVVIPSFNQGEFIARTLDSILVQDHVREVLVLDGGSTDETLDVLASYGSRIAWWSGPDGGQADAVNKGLARARGDYIAWINSDDTYADGAFAHVAEIFARQGDVGVVYGDAHHVDEADRFIEAYPTADFDAAALRERCFICQPAAFFRRRVVVEHGGLRPSLRYCLDYEFWLRLAAGGVTFERCHQVLAHSRLYPHNKTLGERLHAYFETADMLIRGMGHAEGKWAGHFANAAADHVGTRYGIPRALAVREASRLGGAIWSRGAGR